MSRPREEEIPVRREKSAPGKPLVTLQQLRDQSCWWWLVCSGCMCFQPVAVVVQISSDALKAYVDAVEQAFGADVDYGQAVKFYDAEPAGSGRYSPPRVTYSERKVIAGQPDTAHISTSLVERQNLTMRMSMRRFMRLTNAFSKKVENLQAAVSLHFAHYIFVRVHKTLRVTPAMAAGVSDTLWSLGELVERATGA